MPELLAPRVTFLRDTRAREAQADKLFKKCPEIADRNKYSEESATRVQRDRLPIDTRKWAAARLAPKEYGDHISHDVHGSTKLNFQPAILIKVGDGLRVGFAPKADKPAAVSLSPLCAKSGCERMQHRAQVYSITSSASASSVGGSEDVAGVHPRLSIASPNIRAVAQQDTSLNELA